MIGISDILVVILIGITEKVLSQPTIVETCNVTYTKSDTIINYYNNNNNNNNNQSVHCVNNINAPNGYRIVITILELDIPQLTTGHSVCNRNYLSFSPVTPAKTRVLKLCGQTNHTNFTQQKHIVSYNSSLTFIFHIDSQFSNNTYGFGLKIEFVRMCTNVTISVGDTKQNYCSSDNYSISYTREEREEREEREVCMIEIKGEIESNIQVAFTKIITSNISAHRGLFCKTKFIQVIVNDQVDHLCGNWTGYDPQSLPIFSSHNSSIIIKIYAFNPDRDSNLITHQTFQQSIGFCFTYHSSPKDFCRTSSDWFDGPNHCYKVFNERKTWFEAEDTCRSSGPDANLASITSQKIQQIFDDFLLNQTNQNNNISSDMELAFWIGGNDTKYENNFQWVDGQTFLYTNWFPGWPQLSNQDNYGAQPSDDGFSEQNCIEIRNQFYYANKGKGTTLSFYWNDISCLVHNAFICQVPKSTADKKSSSINTTCSKEIILTSYYPWDIISTPNYPSLYPNNLNCTIKVSVTGNFLIELLFTDFHFEEGGPSCLYDYITIDDSRSVRKYCGDWNEKIKLLRSISGNLTINIFTDSSHSQRGLRAELRLINNPKEAENGLCESQRFHYFSNKCYLISSYPEVSWLTANRICQDIQSELINIHNLTDQNAIVSLLLDNAFDANSDLSRPTRAFWLNNDNMKNFVEDSWLSESLVRIDDNEKVTIGDNEKATIGDNRKSCIISTIEKIDASKLVYNNIDCDRQAGYICVKRAFDSQLAKNKTIVNAIEGTIESVNYPNSYTNHLYYTTTIKSNITNSVIVLWFDNIDIEWQKQCLYDYLIIKDTQRNFTICGRFTNKNQLFNLTFISKSNLLSVEFRSDFSNRGSGFKAHWKAIDMDWCRLNQFVIEDYQNSSKTYIQSPGYPTWNLPNLNCTLIIKSNNPNRRVLVTILDFDIDNLEEEYCKFDNYLMLDLGQSKTVQLCGSLASKNLLIGQQFISYATTFKLHYVTSSSLKALQGKRGFKFAHKFVDKHNKLSSLLHLSTNQLGKVANLNYPHECPIDNQIFLKAPISHQIELRLPRLTYMKINDGPNCQFTNDHLIFNIIDPFGDITLTPPNPSIWSVCSESSEPFQTFSTLSSKNIKVIKSKFHVLHIKPYDNKRSSFMFYYKTRKDMLFFNTTINLPQKMPVNTCEYDPCINGGACLISELNQTYCKCPQLWTGIFCHFTLCNRRPCGDHGICKLNRDSGGYVCHCDSGYNGVHCEDTVSPCTKSNPCGDRGSCSLINGATKCKCHSWYEGVHCERLAFKVQYKPLSKKMLEEPFWLGLITVAAVLALLSIIYCIKKKFAERIEAFFAEEIERSKSNYNIPRYSLTSNVGVSLNISPVNISPIPRSRSTFMGRLRRHKVRRSSNINHYSDSEAIAMDQLSDAESGGTFQPIPSFIRHASSARDNIYEVRDEKTRILQSLVGSGNSIKNRRLSFDEFIQTNQRLKMHKLIAIDQSLSDVSISDGESSFISSAKSPSSSPGRKSPICLLRQISAISENSQEDQSSRVTSRNNTLPGDSSSDSINLFQNLQILKQESETEVLLNDIQSIQRASRNNLYQINDDIDNPQPSTSGYTKEKKCNCSSSTSSGSSTPNHHFNPPSITITDVAVEYHDSDDQTKLPVLSSVKNRTSFSSITSELLVPVQNTRRLSEPSATANEGGKRSPSPSSRSCGSPMIKKTLESTKGRKFSLEMPVPKIKINTEKIPCDSNVTPNPCMKSMNYLTPITIINASSDRTISESNLSTSGYSSLSSPGISRCNSSSPFPEEIGGVNAELTTIIIPDVPQMELQQRMNNKANFGNFLQIPIFTFPVRDQTHEVTKTNRSIKPTASTAIVCPQIKISPAESDEHINTSYVIPDDEGIDVDVDIYSKGRDEGNPNSVGNKFKPRPDCFLGLKQNSRDGTRKKKKMPSPTHSLEEFNSEVDRKMDSLRAPKIRRNPSWPAVLISPNSSSSSDSEELSSSKSRQSPKSYNRKQKKIYSTTKTKRSHKKHLKTRSRSQGECSGSINSTTNDNNTLASQPTFNWFHSSSKSSSTESFLSTNDDENTIIALSMPRKHYSSQSLLGQSGQSGQLGQNCDIFNYTSDSDSVAQDIHKKTIASISDSALDKPKVNFSTHSLHSNELLNKKRSKRRIQKQKAMQEDDGSDDACSETSVLLNTNLMPKTKTIQHNSSSLALNLTDQTS